MTDDPNEINAIFDEIVEGQEPADQVRIEKIDASEISPEMMEGVDVGAGITIGLMRAAWGMYADERPETERDLSLAWAQLTQDALDDGPQTAGTVISMLASANAQLIGLFCKTGEDGMRALAMMLARGVAGERVELDPEAAKVGTGLVEWVVSFLTAAIKNPTKGFTVHKIHGPDCGCGEDHPDDAA